MHARLHLSTCLSCVRVVPGMLVVTLLTAHFFFFLRQPRDLRSTGPVTPGATHTSQPHWRTAASGGDRSTPPRVRRAGTRARAHAAHARRRRDTGAARFGRTRTAQGPRARRAPYSSPRRSPPAYPRGATARKAPKREPMPSSASTSTRTKRRRSSTRPNSATRLPRPSLTHGSAPLAAQHEVVLAPTRAASAHTQRARARAARDEQRVDSSKHEHNERKHKQHDEHAKSRNHNHCKAARLAD